MIIEKVERREVLNFWDIEVGDFFESDGLYYKNGNIDGKYKMKV